MVASTTAVISVTVRGLMWRCSPPLIPTSLQPPLGHLCAKSLFGCAPFERGPAGAERSATAARGLKVEKLAPNKESVQDLTEQEGDQARGGMVPPTQHCNRTFPDTGCD
jgi:hypothetical protein